VVLTSFVGVLRLKEEIGARHDPRAIRCGETLTDARFEVVPSLVGSIDAAEAGS
jgi:hypothetical protein